ncbi:Hypothetical predicted protein [Olea europaea subsp. europaea]|uniref:Uncharacterized protein n=1 Tax=Olea europaea subsp. europaea TaxID=158383 RepID=A0A8S0RLZ6_OLEEU|nr:Hypothetical predicted protein [Olea europaea subsp. europaea]
MSVNHEKEAEISNIASVMRDGSSYVTEFCAEFSHLRHIAGTGMKLQDSHSSSSDFGASGMPHKLHFRHLLLLPDPITVLTKNPYYDLNSQQAAYENVYSKQGPYQNPSTQGHY